MAQNLILRIGGNNMLGNSFYEMAVKSKATKDYYGKMILGIFITLLGVLAFPLIGAISLVAVVIGVCIICSFAMDKNVEYEYTFTDGSVEIAAIYNASKRKELFSFELDNVMMIVPKDSPRIGNERFEKKRDYSSRTKDAKTIQLVLEMDKEKHLVILEPDERAKAHIKSYARNKIYND